MGIIDVIVEKPALRREERGEKPTDEATNESTDSGRGGTLRRAAGAVIVGLVGAITFRKLRNRRADRGGEPETGPEREAGMTGEQGSRE